MNAQIAFRIAISAVLLVGWAGHASAQDAYEIPTRVIDQNRTGELPFSTKIGSDIEHVDLATGNLVVTIPFNSVPSRGTDTYSGLTYNASFWIPAPRVALFDPFPTQQWKLEQRPGNAALGWSSPQSSVTSGTREVLCYTSQGFNYYTYFRLGFIFTDPSGTKYPLAIQNSTGTVQCKVQDLEGPDLTGAGIWAKLDSETDWYPEIHLADGTRITTNGAQGPYQWRDSNGNVRLGAGDVLGRALGPDSGGNARNYVVNYKSIPLETNFGATDAYGTGTIYEFASGNYTTIASIVLPDGRSYQFTYEGEPGSGTTAKYGGITKIVLPTGATIEYTWTTCKSADKTRRRVASRTVRADGQSRTWTFSGCFGSNVTDPDGNLSQYFADEGVISGAKFYQGTSTLLRQHVIDYVHDDDPWHEVCLEEYCPTDNSPRKVGRRPIRITTTLEDGKTSKKEFDYETFTYAYHPYHTPPSTTIQTVVTFTTSRGNVVESREYDWGQGAPGGLARRSTRSYLHNSNTIYKNYNIVNKVLARTMYDGAGVQKAQTQYEYDNTALLGPTNAPGHDATYTTSFLYRGNFTRVKNWRNTDGALLTNTYVYDDLGNIRSVTDPGNHTTTYTYNDQWYGTACLPSGNGQAYVTEVKNALNHPVQFTWYPCTGLVQARKDENDILAGRAGTTHTYDLFDRPDISDFPGGGQINRDYLDAANGWVRTRTLQSSGTYVVSYSHSDALGRVKQQQLCEDGADACLQSILTDTIYDNLGRVWKVSNAYRTTSDPTYGITETQYDALGRVTKVIPPDGLPTSNNVTTSYSGNTVTVTDQAGKQRRSYTDALGRLIQVDEPGPNGGGTPAVPGTGSATVSGSLQSAGGTSATPETGSATVSGSLQSKQSQTQAATSSAGSATINGSLRSKQVQTQAATAGTGSVAIAGTIKKVRVWDCPDGQICYEYDHGSVRITVNGFNATVSYQQGSTSSGIASSLASIFNTNPSSLVTANVSVSTVYLTSKATGAASNYSLSATSWTDDPFLFGSPSFTATPSGSTLTGGQDAQYTTVYDSGSVSITVAGFVATANYGQGSNTSSIATDLRNVFNTSPSSPVTAGGIGATVALTSKSTGASTNYALSTSSTYDTANFPPPASFTASLSGSTMTGGQDAQYTTVYDSGTAWITVNGLQKTVSYGQGSSSTSIATALRDAINVDSAYPVSASLSGTTVNLTAKTSGADTNYSLSAGSSYSTAEFSQPSFSVSVSGSTLTGGSDGTPPTYDSGSVWITVDGLTKTVSYGQGSTSDSIASALTSAINADSSYPVSASFSGSTVNLTAKIAGANTNYSLSGGSSTNQPGTFAGPSFTVAVSGSTLGGGADATPPTFSLATPAVTLYTYDTLDNLTCVVQKGTDTTTFTTCAAAPAAWRPRSFTYNSLSQLLTATNPESGAINYAYDSDGNLLTKTDARGITTTHSYDALHRLTGKTYSNGDPAISYFYDQSSYSGLTITNGIGRRTGMSDEAGAEAWSFDALGQVLTNRRTTNGVSKSFTYTYNLGGAVTSIAHPTGRTVTYGYDNAGRALSASDGATTYASAASYEPHGALRALTNGASIVSTYFYNNRLQPCRISVRSAGVSPADCADTAPASIGNILDFNYSFDTDPGAGVANNGNVAAIANNRAPERSQSFAYDELNRLRDFSYGPCANQYTIDVWGNLTKMLALPGSGKPTCDFLDQQANQKNQLVGFNYDTAGNLQSYAGDTYSLDGENRLTTVAGVTYTYDGDGRRVKKGNGKLYWYGTNALDPLLETDIAGGNATEYIFFNGKHTARRDSAGTIHYFFADHLGSSRVVTNSSGAIAEDSDFYPFGGERIFTDTLANQNYRFTGKERDFESASQLDYFAARHYLWRMGRFLQPDTFNPIFEFQPETDDEEDVAEAKQKFNEYIGDPQNWNRYAYVLNRPTTHVDADGRVPIPVIILVAARVAPVAVAIAARYGPQVVRSLQTAGPAISQRLFSLGNAVRGGVVELLQGSPNSWRFVQGIDNFIRGRAISTKSFNIFSDSYKSAPAIISRLSGYVDRLANYTGGRTPDGFIRAEQIQERVLQVVLPKGQLTAEQLKALAKIAEEAAKKGVRVEFYQIK